MWSICLFSMITGFHYWSSVPLSLKKNYGKISVLNIQGCNYDRKSIQEKWE